MKACAPVEQALLDEALPRPEGFEAHLASCPGCGALAQAHRDALRLRGASLFPARRRPLGEVRRRAGILGGLVLALVGGLGWLQLEFDPSSRAEGDRSSRAEWLRSSRAESREPLTEVAPRPEFPMLAVEEPQPSNELLALAQLQASVSADLARDPREDAAAVRAFGALPAWTAPTRTHPMRSLGRLASPVVFTSEDSP